jgi:hypothetical protein
MTVWLLDGVKDIFGEEQDHFFSGDYCARS